jgi:hypothetical protein
VEKFPLAQSHAAVIVEAQKRRRCAFWGDDAA